VCRVDLYLNFLHTGKEKQPYAAEVFKLTFYFSCRQLKSVMHYVRLKAEQKELKKLRRANESNEICLRKFRRRAQYLMWPIPLQSVVEAKSRKVTQDMKTVH
jgi:hypothetical protein